MVFRFVLTILYCLPLFAGGIGFSSDYKASLKRAKSEHKELLLYLYKDKTSIKFLKIFKHLKCSNTLKKHFIAVIKNFDADNSYPVEMFYTRSFPTIFFISSKDETLLASPLRGYISSSEFCLKLKESLKSFR